MYPVLDALDSDPNWDWSQFDVNQDGELDAVVFMHSGYSAIAGETDCTGRADTFRIWGEFLVEALVVGNAMYTLPLFADPLLYTVVFFTTY